MLPSTAGSFPARPRVLGRGSAQSRVQDVAACGPGSWPLGPLQRSGVVVVARQSCWRCVELGCPAVRCRDHVDVAVSPLLSQPVGIHHTMQGRGWIAVSVEGAVQTKMGAAGVAAETVALHESSAQEGRMHPCADLCTYVGVWMWWWSAVSVALCRVSALPTHPLAGACTLLAIVWSHASVMSGLDHHSTTDGWLQCSLRLAAADTQQL